jgi:hypothetical protein
MHGGIDHAWMVSLLTTVLWIPQRQWERARIVHPGEMHIPT